MPQMGLLFVISQPPVAMDEELNEWYTHEHIPERLAIEGFVSALRYVSSVRPRRYLALYDLTHVDVLQSDNYKAFAGANFTPWTKRVVSRSNFTRFELVQSSPGEAATMTASRLLVLRFSSVDSGMEAEIRRGAERCFLGDSRVSQLRIFAGHNDAAGNHFVIVGGNGDLEALIEPQAFAAAAGHLDLVETFCPIELKSRQNANVATF